MLAFPTLNTKMKEKEPSYHDDYSNIISLAKKTAKMGMKMKPFW